MATFFLRLVYSAIRTAEFGLGSGRATSIAAARLYFGVPRATNREIEIKLPVHDMPALVRKLRSLKVRHLHGRVFEQNTLYDTPDSDFRSAGRLLRLRVETPARSRLLPAGPR